MSETGSLLDAVRPHLIELRRRLIVSVIVLFITTFASFAVAEYFIKLLCLPVGGVEALQSIEVTENIGVFMRVSLISGVIFAFPILLYEALAFIVPGLKPNEKKLIYLLLPLGTVLFLSGVAFAYFVMLPTALPFLTGFIGGQTIPRYNSYISFVTNLIFWMGVAFETPIFILILAKLKVVSARSLLKYWRAAIIIIAFLAAVITPTVDPVNMALLMVPLILLYFLSILLAAVAA